MPPHPDATVDKPLPQQASGGSRDSKDMSVREPVRTDYIGTSRSYSEPTVSSIQAEQYGSPISTAYSMFKEAERLKSFEGWPVTFLSPRQMAAAGFYYIKVNDVVRCMFCNVEVGQWVPGDDPMSDHKKWSPSCRFVRNVPNNGNVPIGDDEASQISENGYDTCGAFGINIQNPEKGNQSLEKLKVQKARPASYPNYVTLESRLRSFESWPVSLKLKPQTLSEAGFFYTGKGDQTLCFHCGGGLKDWEDTDEPWVEHARWFSRCNYVITMKGQAFVDEVSGQKAKTEMEQNLAKMSSSSSMGNLDHILDEEKLEKEEAKELETALGTSGAESQSNANDMRLCKICYEEEMGVAFLPCGHVVACPKCALSLTKCASCRKPISATVRVYLS